MRLTKKNYARVVVAIYDPFEAPKQEKKLRARSCGACALKMPQIDPVLTIVHSNCSKTALFWPPAAVCDMVMLKSAPVALLCSTQLYEKRPWSTEIWG